MAKALIEELAKEKHKFFLAARNVKRLEPFSKNLKIKFDVTADLIEFDAQESILYEISDQIVMEWEEVLLVEQQDIIDECTLADIDFEFVIDASGSVGGDNWKLTMDQIAEENFQNNA